MACPPQCRQRYISAYQPTPNSSKPACGVSSPQSRQNRWKRSAWRPAGVSLRQAKYDAVHHSSNAAITRRQPRPRPPRCTVGARLTLPKILRSMKGRAARAIIAFSYETPISLHQPCQRNFCQLLARSGLRFEMAQSPLGKARLPLLMSGTGQTEKDRLRRSTAGQPPTTEMLRDRPTQPVSATSGHHDVLTSSIKAG